MKYLLALLIVVMLSCQSQKVDPVVPAKDTSNAMKFWGMPPADLDKPSWKILSIDSCGVRVAYQEKYGSLLDTTCIGLWESTNQYMLTWKDGKKLVLEKSNIVYIKSGK